MAIDITLPSVDPVPADTIVGRKIILAVLPTGGTQANYRCTIAEYQRSNSTIERKAGSGAPGSTKIVRDRVVLQEVIKSMTVTVDEFSSGFTTQFMNADQVEGTVRAWFVDPGDAANTARLSTNEVAALVYHDGSMSLNKDDFTTATLKIDFTGTLTFSRDQLVS